MQYMNSTYHRIMYCSYIKIPHFLKILIFFSLTWSIWSVYRDIFCLNLNLLSHHPAQNYVDLSIVIPCYNTGLLMHDLFVALSRLQLELKSKQEIHFSVSKSTDNTVVFIKRYIDNHTNAYLHYFDTRYYTGELRNFALQFVKGTYVVFVDADDTVDVLAMQGALTEALFFRPDVLILPYTIVYVKENAHAYQSIDNGYNIKDTLAESRLRALRMVNFPWNKLYLYSHIRKHNITFGTSLVHNDIQFHWLSLALSKYVKFSTGQTVYYHKIIQDNTTRQLTQTGGVQRFQMFSALREAYMTLVMKVDGFCTSELSKLWADNVKSTVDWTRMYHISSDMIHDFQSFYHNTSITCFNPSHPT
jgi:hypothetical protein